MDQIHMDKVESHVAALQVLKDDNRLRSLKPRAGIDFTSNDYLALASAPHLKKAVLAALDAGMTIGAGGYSVQTPAKHNRGRLSSSAS